MKKPNIAFLLFAICLAVSFATWAWVVWTTSQVVDDRQAQLDAAARAATTEDARTALASFAQCNATRATTLDACAAGIGNEPALLCNVPNRQKRPLSMLERRIKDAKDMMGGEDVTAVVLAVERGLSQWVRVYCDAPVDAVQWFLQEAQDGFAHNKAAAAVRRATVDRVTALIGAVVQLRFHRRGDGGPLLPEIRMANADGLVPAGDAMAALGENWVFTGSAK